MTFFLNEKKTELPSRLTVFYSAILLTVLNPEVLNLNLLKIFFCNGCSWFNLLVSSYVHLKPTVDYLPLCSVRRWGMCLCGLDIPFKEKSCSPGDVSSEARFPAHGRNKMGLKQGLTLKSELTSCVQNWIFIITNLWYYPSYTS